MILCLSWVRFMAATLSSPYSCEVFLSQMPIPRTLLHTRMHKYCLSGTFSLKLSKTQALFPLFLFYQQAFEFSQRERVPVYLSQHPSLCPMTICGCLNNITKDMNPYGSRHICCTFGDIFSPLTRLPFNGKQTRALFVREKTNRVDMPLLMEYFSGQLSNGTGFGTDTALQADFAKKKDLNFGFRGGN